MVDVLTLQYRDCWFVTPAAGIVRFGALGDAAGEVHDLDRHLGDLAPVATDDMRNHQLRVETGDREMVLGTNARLRLSELDDQVFFQLPRILREGGCDPWVRGVVLLEPRGRSEGEAILGVWIDLMALARSLGDPLAGTTDS